MGGAGRLAGSLVVSFRRGRRFAFFTWAAVTAWTLAAVEAVAAIEPVAAITISEPAPAALVALAVAIGLAHHGRLAFLVRVHPDGEVAQDILVESLLAFDLGERGRR